MRALAFLTLLTVPLSAAAQDDASKCGDDYNECKDNCSLRFGMSARDTERAQLTKCMNRCKRAETSCRAQYFDAKNSGLAPGAVKNDKPDDDLREDNKKKSIVSEEPAPKKAAPKEEEPTRTKASDLDAPKKSTEPAPAQTQTAQTAPTAEKPEEKKEEPAAKKKTEASAPEPKKKKKDRALDEWDPEAL